MSLSQERSGKSAIVFFWATWCPHCRVALKELSRDRANIEKKDIKIILVDMGERIPEVNDHIKKQNIPFDSFVDENSTLAETYAIIGVPTFFFVRKDGIVQAVEHQLPSNYEAILLGQRGAQDAITASSNKSRKKIFGLF